MLNLLKSELRSIAKKRSINGYKSVSKNELINAINNKKIIFKSKGKEIKKVSSNPQRRRFLNQ